MNKLKKMIDRECKACEKPHNCWLGCKVNFRVVYLQELLREEKEEV